MINTRAVIVQICSYGNCQEWKRHHLVMLLAARNRTDLNTYIQNERKIQLCVSARETNRETSPLIFPCFNISTQWKKQVVQSLRPAASTSLLTIEEKTFTIFEHNNLSKNKPYYKKYNTIHTLLRSVPSSVSNMLRHWT